MNGRVDPRATITLVCPQEPGLRAVRNSVVSYRLLNPYNTSQLSNDVCSPATITPADTSGGGAVTCTSANPIWPAILEITCCLN